MSPRLRPALGSRDKTVLLVGLVSIALMLVVFRGMPALRGWRSAAIAAASEIEIEVRRAEASVRSLPGLRETLAVRNARIRSLGEAFLQGETHLAAGSRLTTMINAIAAESNVRITSIQIGRGDDSLSSPSRLTASVSATSDVRGIAALLQAMESGPQLLTVQRLHISQPDVLSLSDRPEALRIDLVVDGLLLLKRSVTP